jgi:hypothetical protein
VKQFDRKQNVCSHVTYFYSLMYIAVLLLKIFFLRVLYLTDIILKFLCFHACNCLLKNRINTFICPCTKFHAFNLNFSSFVVSRLNFRSIKTGLIIL